MRTKTWRASALAAVTLVALSACGGTDDGTDGTGDAGGGTTTGQQQDAPTDEKTPAVPQDLFFTDAGALRDAMDDLAEAVGTDDLQLLDLTVHGDFVVLQAADPKKPDEVNQWTWRDGSVEPSVPVKLVGAGDLRTNLFPASSMDPAVVVKAARSAPRDAELKKGEVSHVIYGRDLPASEDVLFRVHVNGAGGSKVVTHGLKGKVLRVD